MKMIPVQSSSLSAVGYDTREKTLRVQFLTGKVYRYSNVPEQIFRDLLNAESKGRFFNERIRDDFAYDEELPKSKRAFS